MARHFLTGLHPETVDSLLKHGRPEEMCFALHRAGAKVGAASLVEVPPGEEKGDTRIGWPAVVMLKGGYVKDKNLERTRYANIRP